MHDRIRGTRLIHPNQINCISLRPGPIPELPVPPPVAGGSIDEPFFNSAASAYNGGASKPPKVMLGDDLVGWLTTNSEQFEANAIDPNVLFAYYGCLY